MEMDALVWLAEAISPYGVMLMILGFAIMIFAPGWLAKRGKPQESQWVSVAVVVIAALLAFSQIVLGMAHGDSMSLVFGLVCLVPLVSNIQRLKESDFLQRLRWKRESRKMRKKAVKRRKRKQSKKRKKKRQLPN
jgi:hypothetical protein